MTDSLNPLKKDDGEICDSVKGLSCLTGKCECTPLVSVYEESVLGAIGLGKFGGACVGAASKPCLDSNCVKNALCEGGFCSCNEGYQGSPEGFCSSGSNLLPAIAMMSLLAKIFN